MSEIKVDLVSCFLQDLHGRCTCMRVVVASFCNFQYHTPVALQAMHTCPCIVAAFAHAQSYFSQLTRQTDYCLCIFSCNKNAIVLLVSNCLHNTAIIAIASVCVLLRHHHYLSCIQANKSIKTER